MKLSDLSIGELNRIKKLSPKDRDMELLRHKIHPFGFGINKDYQCMQCQSFEAKKEGAKELFRCKKFNKKLNRDWPACTSFRIVAIR